MPKANTTEYKRAFVEKNYDRIAVTIPKGRKETVERIAQESGVSVNGLINDLLRDKAGMSAEEWKAANAEK